MLTAKKRATSGIGEVDFSTERKGDLTWRTGYPTINAPASEYVITGPTSGDRGSDPEESQGPPI